MNDIDTNTLMHYVAANDLDSKSRLLELIEMTIADKKEFTKLKAALNKDNQTPLVYAESVIPLSKDKEENELRKKRVEELIKLDFPQKSQKN